MSYWIAFLVAICHHFAYFPMQEKPSGDARAQVIGPYLDEQALAVLHLDLSRVDVDAAMTKADSFFKLDSKDTDSARYVAEKAQIRRWAAEFTKAGGKDIYGVVSLADMPAPLFVIVPLAKGAKAETIRNLLRTGTPDAKEAGSPFAVCERIGDVIFAGCQDARERIGKLKSAPRRELSHAFAAAGDGAAQAVLFINADTRRSIEETLPEWPAQLGGGPVTVLTQGVTWAGLGVDVIPKMAARLVIKSKDKSSAEALSAWLGKTAKLVGNDKEVRRFWPNFDELVKKIMPKIDGDRLTVTVDEPTLIAVLQPAVSRTRVAADRARDVNSLKQIGLALHSYHDVISHLPRAANYDKDGKPLLSWRVHILPYLDNEHFYKQFKLDEPWDSEHNKKLVAKMPAVYRSIEKLEPGKTTFLGVAGDRAMFPSNKAVKLLDVRDGTSNTIIVVDADETRAVEWTKPEDYKYDPANPGAGLTGRFGGRFAAAFCDGSVRMISGKIEAKILNLLFDRDDGQVIGEIP